MNESVGKKLKILRKGRKLNQQDVADRLGVSRVAISNYEIGRRNCSLPMLKKFAEFYGVGLDYFGVVTTDEMFDLMSRAKQVFENDDIPTDQKQDLYEEIMRLYLELKRS